MSEVGLDFCHRNQISTARYNPDHNWCWFSVACQKTVAVFRLNFEQEVLGLFKTFRL